MLRTPEVATRTAQAVRKERPDLEDTKVVAALAQFDDLAGLSDRYVSRLLRLEWLAPEVLDRLVVHREPSTISIYGLCFVASLP